MTFIQEFEKLFKESLTDEEKATIARLSGSMVGGEAYADLMAVYRVFRVAVRAGTFGKMPI
jgi:hypothetical protein